MVLSGWATGGSPNYKEYRNGNYPSEQIDINNQFAPLATYVKKVVWQRLGYILENVVGEKKLADKLYEQLRTSSGYFKYQPLSTSAEDNPSVRDSRWKININVEIETDDI